MKFNRTGRLEKEKTFVGSTDLQNITTTGWQPVKVDDFGFQVPHQSISVMSSNTSELSPNNLTYVKARES